METEKFDESRPEKPLVSSRKVEANRRNARKSTGPRTSRGKAFSSRNALKHGLFIRHTDSFLEEEDPEEFQRHYARLRNELLPVGFSEEAEVEHIAIGWLRLQRLWRFENAEIRSSVLLVDSNVERGYYNPCLRSATCNTQMSLLETAEKEVEVAGQISPQLIEKIFAGSRYLEVQWPGFQRAAEKIAQMKRKDIAKGIAERREIPLSEARSLLARDTSSLPEYSCFVLLETVREAIRYLRRKWLRRSHLEIQTDCRRLSIPDDGAIDKVIRYGNACERLMTRSYDRLERLQRRRKGETEPPTVRVRLGL